jgi:hypothetical protein
MIMLEARQISYLIRAFARALHKDDALGKLLFFHGRGDNGKSALIPGPSLAGT